MIPQPHLSAPDKLHNILRKPKRNEEDRAGLAVGRIVPELEVTSNSETNKQINLYRNWMIYQTF
jgi:hypothetical protein